MAIDGDPVAAVVVFNAGSWAAAIEYLAGGAADETDCDLSDLLLAIDGVVEIANVEGWV